MEWMTAKIVSALNGTRQEETFVAEGWPGT